MDAMDAESLKVVRALPLFSNLSDDQLSCLDGAEIVEYREGDVIVSDGDPARYFYVNIEGEISVHRMYDNQEILMGVGRSGNFMGEIFILLDIPWNSFGSCRFTIARTIASPISEGNPLRTMK